MPRPRSTVNPLDAIEADASSRSFLPSSRPDPRQRSSPRAPTNRLRLIRRSTTSSTLLPPPLHPPSSRPAVCTPANLCTWADRRPESLATRLCHRLKPELEKFLQKFRPVLLLYENNARGKRKRGKERERSHLSSWSSVASWHGREASRLRERGGLWGRRVVVPERLVDSSLRRRSVACSPPPPPIPPLP